MTMTDTDWAEQLKATLLRAQPEGKRVALAGLFAVLCASEEGHDDADAAARDHESEK